MIEVYLLGVATGAILNGMLFAVLLYLTERTHDGTQ